MTFRRRGWKVAARQDGQPVAWVRELGAIALYLGLSPRIRYQVGRAPSMPAASLKEAAVMAETEAEALLERGLKILRARRRA